MPDIDALPESPNLPGQLYVDICTDKSVAMDTVLYRQQQGCILLQVYETPQVTTTYVTSAHPYPTGVPLPVPLGPSWVVLSTI
jgi:hypothetical protein